MKEGNLARLIILAASKHGHRLFINTRGLAWRKDGSPVRYGFGPNGASDLIGWTRDGRFAALEIKTATGRIHPAQQQFVDAVRKARGVAGVVRTVEEALAILNASSGHL